MRQKILIACMLISIINYIGCYSADMVTRNELEHGFSSEISLLTKDNETYYFPEHSYRLEKDSLSGKGRLLKSDYTFDVFNGKIALSDIELITGKKVDEGKTALLILGAIGISLIIYLLADLHQEVQHSFN